MWPFNSQPTLEAELSPVDRVGETHRRVCAAKVQLDTIDAEMLAFKTKHRVKTDRFGRLLGIQCGMNERAGIEANWRDLLKRRDAVVARWHEALHTWAEAKKG